MKKFLLSLVLVAFATSINAQTVAPVKQEVKKECCKEHKDGQQCNKPADQQCPDCKAKAAQGQCDKAQMKGECKKAAQGQCDKAQMKKDCCKDKKMEGKKCDKPADQQCPDCKEKAVQDKKVTTNKPVSKKVSPKKVARKK